MVCFLCSTYLCTGRQVRRRKTLLCLPVMSESSWPSECWCVCTKASDPRSSSHAAFGCSEPPCAHRALDLPLKDLSFDDIAISLSRGPLPIYDCSSLLQFNQLTCRLGWVLGDWDHWWGCWVQVAPLWGTLTPTGGWAEAQETWVHAEHECNRIFVVTEQIQMTWKKQKMN